MGDIVSLKNEVRKNHPDHNLEVLDRVYAFAVRAYEGEKPEPGLARIRHALATAMLLAGLRLDPDTVAAALLHDVLAQTDISGEGIRNLFGESIAGLVDGLTKLNLITWEKLDSGKVGGLQKMFLAMVKDVRIVIIKLAEHLDKLQNGGHFQKEDRVKIARESLFIYAPLASRLGIWTLKRDLEDQAFKYMEPGKYSEIARLLSDSKAERKRIIGGIIRFLESELAKNSIHAEVSGRSKHIYSIHKKMEATEREFSAIYDIQAVRILVASVEDCYAVLDVIHRLWTPVKGEFDDYIAKPKMNGYRSLHTAVTGPEDKPMEIQIRTYEMHRRAEYGIASHWRYKEGGAYDSHVDEKVNYLRILLGWQQELPEHKEYFRSLGKPPLAKYVYVLTPKGDVFDLPAGATPLDFAYRIHTNVGHRCRGAKVNGKLVPLDHKLRNGDRVEIIKAKEARPSRDWLNPRLGYVYTPRVRQKIRQWFRTRDRSENVSRGREIMDRELKRLGIKEKNFEETASQFGYDKPDDFFEAIGYGDLSVHHVKAKLSRDYEDGGVHAGNEPGFDIANEISAVSVKGDANYLTRTAQCCRPLPGDDIVGFVTKGRGVTVHRRDCHNILRQDDKDRLIDVNWGKGKQSYAVSIRIEAVEAKKILKETAALVEAEDARITTSSMNRLQKESVSVVHAVLEISSAVQLNRILHKIRSLPTVIKAKKQTH